MAATPWRWLAVSIALLLALPVVPTAATEGTTDGVVELPGPPQAGPDLRGFLENGGQLDDGDVLFYSWAPEGGLAILDDGVLITTVGQGPGTRIGCNVLLEFPGSSPSPPVGRSPLPGVTNFLKGNDPDRWARGLVTYQQVAFQDLHDGIDLVYRLDGPVPKYDVVVRPGADVSDLVVRVTGHRALALSKGGDLVISTPAGNIVDGDLLAFYEGHPEETLDCSFRLLGGDAYGFSLGPHDPTRTVVIDPLIFSTFVGGRQGEWEIPWGGVILDSQNRSVVAGHANTTDFPTTAGAFQRDMAGGDTDVFVFRLDALGNRLEWCTYLGGSRDEFAFDIDMDWMDAPIIVGRTNSSDWPIRTGYNPYKGTHTGEDHDGFIIKLFNDGSNISFSTYVGGSDTDDITAVRYHGSEGYMVMGNTKSTDLGTSNGSYQQNHSGGVFDIFLAHFMADLSGVNWITYYGGSGWDVVSNFDYDVSGNLVFVGQTTSDNMSMPGAYQGFRSGGYDGFVADFSSHGNHGTFFSYLGGALEDMAQYVHILAGGQITIGGFTESTLFPTTNGSYQTLHGGKSDIFATRFNHNASVMEWSTLIGGASDELLGGMALDPDRNVNLVGRSLSDDFNTLRGAFQEDRKGEFDGVVVELMADGSDVLYSSYIGGSRRERTYGIYLDPGGNATIVGATESTDYPVTVGAYQEAHGGRVDVFVSKLDLYLDLEPPVSVPGKDMVVDQHATVEFDGSDSTDNVGVVNWTWTFEYNGTERTVYGPSFSWIFDLAGRYHVFLTVRDAVGNEGTEWVSVFVNDIEPPVAIAPPDMSGLQHWTVTLDGLSSHDNVGITRYRWTFRYGGEDLTLRGGSIDFTFDEAGTYVIVLEVADEAGNTGSDTFTVFIQDITAPVADAGEDVVVGQSVPVVFNGTNSTDNVGIQNMTWQLVYAGVPIELYGPEPVFTFDRPGRYDVTLYVTDMVGNSGHDSMRITVLDTEPPVAVLQGDVTVDQGTTVTLDGSGSSDNVDIVDWRWTMVHGDEVTNFSGERTSVTLAAAGVYRMSLNVTDAAGNWDVASFTVTVRDTTDPEADPGEGQTVGQGTVVNLDGTNSTDNVGIIAYTWTVHEGTERYVKTGPRVTHVFNWSGTYRVELTVLDSAGLTDTAETMVVVLDTEPPVAVVGEGQRVPEGTRVFLNATLSADNEGIAKYTWTFNYNQAEVELVGAEVSHVFLLKGTYTVTLTVEDHSGNEATATTTVDVYGEVDDGDDGSEYRITYWPLILIAAGVTALVAIIALALVRWKRRRDKRDFGWAPTEEELTAREEESSSKEDSTDGESPIDLETADERSEEGT